MRGERGQVLARGSEVEQFEHVNKCTVKDDFLRGKRYISGKNMGGGTSRGAPSGTATWVDHTSTASPEAKLWYCRLLDVGVTR